MDNLKTLFEKGKYELIIELTSSSDDVTSTIYRLNALIALEKYQEALNLISIRKDIIYQKDPIRCMDIHIDLLLHENKLMDAVKAINDYKNMPYISQKVEEHLKELPNRLNVNTVNSNEKEINEEEIINLFLKSTDNEKIIANVYKLKKYDITPFIPSLKTMLLRGDLSNECKTMGLLLLISKKVDIDLAINKLNSVYHVNPKKATPPFTDRRYNEVVDYIYKLIKDASVQEIAISLLNEYILLTYPIELLVDRTTNDIAVIFISIAKKYLNIGEDITLKCDDIDSVEASIEIIKMQLGK